MFSDSIILLLSLRKLIYCFDLVINSLTHKYSHPWIFPLSPDLFKFRVVIAPKSSKTRHFQSPFFLYVLVGEERGMTSVRTQDLTVKTLDVINSVIWGTESEKQNNIVLWILTH